MNICEGFLKKSIKAIAGRGILQFLKARVNCGNITRNKENIPVVKKTYELHTQKQESAKLVVSVPGWCGKILT